MNIVVDAGNTFCKVGWFEGDTLVRSEHRVLFPDLPEVVRASPGERLLISSVSHDVAEFRQRLQPFDRIWNLGSETPVPIVKSYDTPATLGNDRLAAAVGASGLFPNENLVVIDLGTCVTYDLVSAEGRFEGGLISPGLRMRFEAMHTFTRRLPLVEPETAPTFIGKSTRQALLSGVTHGMGAELKGIISTYRSLVPEVRVVVCGGDVPFFENQLAAPVSVVPELVLIGLNRILNYNVALHEK